jgi:hypothetical protein
LYAYRLARDLGYANVDRMLDEMDAGHLTEWVAFETIRAEDERRAELQAKAEARTANHKRRG